jgi:hypothetical protein
MRGDRKPTRDAWQRLPTLGSAASVGMDMVIFCEDCAHEVYIKPLAFAREHSLPLTTTWWLVAQHLKCRTCGSIKVGIMAAPHGHFERGE